MQALLSDRAIAKNLHLCLSGGIGPISKARTSESSVIFSTSLNCPSESSSK